MTIDELKRALMEVREICDAHPYCSQKCPFYMQLSDCCPMKFKNYPENWDIDDWKEDSNIESHKSNL